MTAMYYTPAAGQLETNEKWNPEQYYAIPRNDIYIFIDSQAAIKIHHKAVDNL